MRAIYAFLNFINLLKFSKIKKKHVSIVNACIIL